MPENVSSESLLLPEGSRLFYIGPPKTGTTAVQNALAQARPTLLEHGVFYPGDEKNHRYAAFAFMRRPDVRLDLIAQGVRREEARRVPPRSAWREFLADVEADTSSRVVISHESLARATPKAASKLIREAGGGRAHVVITLRALSDVLPSRWAQSVKGGIPDSLEHWLRRYYELIEDEPIAMGTHRYLDQAGLVERWAEAVGSENVTVIVLDKSNREQLTDTFERLLGLPAGVLTGVVEEGRATNRAYTLAEAEIIRQVNMQLIGTVPHPLTTDAALGQASWHMLGQRNPGRDEPRVRLPQWAAELAVQDGKAYAARIADSGVRVIGDLANLYAPPSVAEDEPDEVTAAVSREIAVEALTGASIGAADVERQMAEKLAKLQQQASSERRKCERAQRRIEKLEQRSIRDQVRGLPASARPGVAASSFTARDLMRGLAWKVSSRLRAVWQEGRR